LINYKFDFLYREVEVSVSHEPKETDHAWLKIEQKIGNVRNRYRKYVARDYNEFDVNRFVELVKLEHNRDMNVCEKATRLIDNIMRVLDYGSKKAS